MTDQRYWQRLNQPPPQEDMDQEVWQRDVTDSVNSLPPMSTFSFATPESNVTAQSGSIGVNLSDGSESLWFKSSGQGNTGWTPIAPPVYGGMFVEDGTGEIADADSGTTIIIFVEEMPTLNVSIDTGAGSLIPNRAGVYEMYGSFSGKADTGSVEMAMYFYVNNVNTELGSHRKYGNANDSGNNSMSGITHLDAGDIVSVWVKQEGGTGADWFLEDGQFHIKRIG